VLTATAELVAERGFLGLTIAVLVKRARVSLLTVDKLYGDKLGCYLAVLDNAAAEARRGCAQALEAAHGEPQAMVEAVLGGLFETAAASPAVARASLLEPFAAGAEAIERHRRALAELGTALLKGSGEPSETMAIGMGAAVLWPVGRCLLEGEPDAIPALAPDAVKFTIAARRRAEWSQSRAAKDAGRSRAHAGEPSDEPPADARVLGRLPTGRHGMTRAAVRHSQRERLLAGAVEAVAERGYAETRIGDIVARAAVSRRAFYESFRNVEECFLGAAEIVARHLGEIATEAATAEKADPPGKAIAALRAALGFLASEPDLARACMVESLAAGAVGQRRYREAVDGFAAALRTSLAVTPGGGASAGSVQMAVGSVAMVISLRIAAGQVEELPSLESELAELLLSPLTG
jgi:AcrR family transcriptional regulator